MPISVQIMGVKGNEDALFQLGKRIEEQFGGYTRCKSKNVRHFLTNKTAPFRHKPNYT